MCRRVRAFFSRHPLFSAACVAVVAIALADRNFLLGIGAALACGLLIGGWRKGAVWALCGIAAASVFAWRVACSEKAAGLLLESAAGEIVEARVLEDARSRDGFWSVRAKLLRGAASGTVIFWKSHGEAPVAGSIVRARGHFVLPSTPRNPGEFDETAWLWRQGMAAVFKTGREESEVSTSRLAKRVAGIRKGFRDSIVDGMEEGTRKSQVILAVVLGEHPVDAEGLVMDFLYSGTLHVFSVSGLHVGMVGMLGWMVLMRAGVSRRWAVVALVPLMFGYSWLSGNSPPAVRAACMAVVFLAAFVFRRRPDLLNALGAVLLVTLLWDGRLLFHPGVQLSYGVVCAISLGVTVTSRWFSWIKNEELYLPIEFLNRRQRVWRWLTRKTAQSLAVSTAASIGSTPLTVWHFGLITPASIPATVFQIPFVFALLGLALFSAMVHPVLPSVSRGVNWANGWLAEATAGIARGFAAIPGGNVHFWRGGKPRLIVYDLNYGAGAACFTDGKGRGVLLDCGDAFGFGRKVAPSLRRMGITPDAVVLSHPDGRHLGGASEVWKAFPIHQAMMPVREARSPSYREWMALAPSAGIRLHHAEKGNILPFPGNAWLEILHVAPESFKDAAGDERVMISRLRSQGWKILFTSDAGMSTEKRLLREGAGLSADVIVAGRHIRDFSLHDDFIERVKPRAIIVSSTAFPVEQRLCSRQAAYWRSLGIAVFDQLETGAVSVEITPSGAMDIRGFVNGQHLTLAPR